VNNVSSLSNPICCKTFQRGLEDDRIAELIEVTK